MPPGEAQQSAVSPLLAVLGAVRRSISDPDRIFGWTVVNGFVQAGPGYAATTATTNAASDLLTTVFDDAG